MKKTLIEQICYIQENGDTDELEFLLDPNKSVLMYIHLREKNLNLPKKYAIKVCEEFFPRLFDNMTEALDFASGGFRKEKLSGREEAFMHLSLFELFNIQEI